MKNDNRLLFTSLVFAILSFVIHSTLPNQTVDIQLHDTYFVLTKASIFFPAIFFFLLFGSIHLYLEKKKVKESKISKYYYWVSLVISFFIIATLFAKAWWISQGIPPMGSPEFYSLIKTENWFTGCFLVLLAAFLIFQVVYFISLMISIFKK